MACGPKTGSASGPDRGGDLAPRRRAGEARPRRQVPPRRVQKLPVFGPDAQFPG